MNKKQIGEKLKSIMKARKYSGQPYIEQSVPGYEYEAVMDCCSCFCENLSDEEKRREISFLIDVYIRDIQSTRLREVIELPHMNTRQLSFAGIYSIVIGEEKQEEKVELNLAETSVITDVWDQEKMRDAIRNVFQHGFQYIKMQHQAYYYPELELCEVYNGNHHVEAGKYFKNGKITAEVIHLSKLYDLLDTDGVYWISRENGNKLGRVRDFRMAILYELARRKDWLEIPGEEESPQSYVWMRQKDWINKYIFCIIRKHQAFWKKALRFFVRFAVDVVLWEMLIEDIFKF